MRWLRLSQEELNQLELLKYPVSTGTISEELARLFKLRFSSAVDNTSRPKRAVAYFFYRQKRYRRRKLAPERKKALVKLTAGDTQATGDLTSEQRANLPAVLKNKKLLLRFRGRPNLVSRQFVDRFYFSTYRSHRSLRRRRKKPLNLTLLLSRRLLRTRRTLVLPISTGMTLIATSRDVIHSWFVPGLGVKIDAIPGRSTHHSFSIDAAGFYYGQCAEICGRYHHHMPIRVCGLSYEQFLI